LPVEIPDGRVFDGFLHGLAAATKPVARRFERGTLFPDGRMDMCKQVVRPRFTELCETAAGAADRGVIKHFLLGNNVVFRQAVGAVQLILLLGLLHNHRIACCLKAA
jgi:hypothetical protein